MTDSQIFHRYFEQVIKKYNSLPVKNVKKFNFNSKNEFAKALNLKPSQFIAVCGKDNELDEIRICFSLDRPGNEKVIDCQGKIPT